MFFGDNSSNLRNEKVSIKVYNNKAKLNIEETTINEILSIGNSTEMKKEVKISTCVNPSLTWMWFAVSLLPISMLISSILGLV